MKRKILFTVGVMLLAAFHVSASGPLGIYGIVEKVVFEPNERPSEFRCGARFCTLRARCRTAFSSSHAHNEAIWYFKLRSGAPGCGPNPRWRSSGTNGSTSSRSRAPVNRLASVAGLGACGRILRPSFSGRRCEGTEGDFRVRPAFEAPASPAVYQTNAGIVKLSGEGGHEWIVKQLRDALKRSPETENPYGSRSASTGSTAEARQAGSQVAASATAASRTDTAANPAGSCGATPMSRLPMTGVTANAPSQPDEAGGGSRRPGGASVR